MRSDAVMGKIVKVLKVISSLALFVAIWELIVLTGRYEPSLLPSPVKVLEGMGELVKDGTLITHFKVSLSRFITGYAMAVITGISLGLVLGYNKKVWEFVEPVVQLLRPVSPIAWFPFIVLWFGIGDVPAIIIIFIAGFFPTLLSTVSGVRKVDPVYLNVANNFGIRQPHLLFKIILPAAFPMIANGLHIALGTAWVFLVAGEMVGAQSGLGYLIIDSRNSLRSDLVLAGIIFIGISGLVLDRLIKLLEGYIERQWGVSDGRRN
jgi:NitT/TauT family transport system permease protein